MKQKLLYIILIITCAFAWSGDVWGNETTISGGTFNNVQSGNTLTWGGSHVSFKLYGSDMNYYGLYGALQLGWDKSYTLSWTVNTACTINVTNVSLKARTSMEGYITLNGTKSNNLYHASNQTTISTGTISKGNSGTISIVTSNNKSWIGAKPNFFIYQISITYTITPDAPVASPTSATVDVTLDANNPQEVNLSSYFSSTALSSDSHFGSLSYTTSSGGTISNGKFYATSAGTYTVKAYLAAQDNCHNRSSDSNALTITVNRRTGSIIAKNGPFSMTAKNTMDLSSCISSSLGTGTISYEVTSSNKNSAVISGSNFTPSASGTYTIKATKAQDSQYSTANTTFNVTANKIQNTLNVSNQSLKVEETNVGYTTNTKNSDATVQYEISDENYTNESQNNGTGVISYDTKTNTITALNAGTATLRIYQDANAAYEAVDKTLTVSVTKYDQTLNWTNSYEKNIVVGTTVSGAAAVTASSNLTAITYSSSNAAIASVNSNGDVTGVSASNDDVTITATQSGNYKYNPVSATRDFHVIAKQEAIYTVSGFTGTTPTIYVGDTPTITVDNIASDFTYTSSDETVVGIAKSGNVITLTALKAGTSTVTLDQPNNSTHSHVSATYNVTVAKVANTLGVTLSSTSVLVDGTINVSFSEQNNEGTAIVGTIIEQSLSSSVNQTINNETPVITYVDGVITACNAGTAKITFTQAETDKYESFTSSTYTITVLKHSNSIVATVTRTEDDVSSTNLKLKYGKTATFSYTYENTFSTPTVTRRSGMYTTRSGNTITAGNSPGTDIYEITQAETYKYETGYASFTIRVNNTDEVEGYVCYDESQYSHGTGSGVMHTYTLSGPGETLSYEVTRDLWAIYYHMYVESSPDNSNWTQIQDNQSIEDQKRWRGFSETVPENARYVRFRFPGGGDLTKYIRNTKVTRKTYLSETHDNTTLGTVLTGTTKIVNFNVSYSSTNGGNISIRSDNEHFVPSISSIAVEVNKMATSPGGTQYICGVDGSQAFTVTYTPDPGSLGDESATIFIEDLFNTKTITLTATAAKRDNTLAVIGAQDLKVDDEVDVYSSKNSSAELSYSFSRNGVATYNPATNKLTAIGAGTTTLTLTQLENDSHYGTTKTVEINVSKYDQKLSWDKELDGTARTLEVGNHLLTNTATATSGLSVTYSSSNASALEVNATTGELTAKAGGSNIAITVTQSGNYKYNEATSLVRYFTVISKIDPTVITTLSESITNDFHIGSDGITIGCNASLTETSLTISDGTKVSKSFSNNTFTLTALAEGTVTVTLTRAEDDAYNAVNKTYTIQVIKPVLVLNPSEAPVINYQDYSSVTYSGTLKSGYSTIALPFNTTVQDIVGNDYDSATDWVAQLSVVTYNAKDGYTLYFKKVEGGAITANQPYILHLGSAVENPIWTDLTNGVQVAQATEDNHAALTGYNGYEHWTMVSNYTPGLSMKDKYGVVNADNCLKVGGEGSTLNAYHAYIMYNSGSTPALVKAAYLDEDEADGILELINNQENQSGDQLIYDLQGRRLPRAQAGINIVIRDGKVRKEIEPRR